MSYRQLFIAVNSHISTKDNQLVVMQGDHPNHIPLADVSIIILESHAITLTAQAIAECSRFNIVLLFCDQKKMPTTYTLPLNQHYRPYEVFLLQQRQPESMQANLTEQVLKQKLRNQQIVMQYCQRKQESIDLLDDYLVNLTGKDEQNREGTAAKVFFHSLYGDEFLRFADDYYNDVLNYGYGILRSALSRVLMAYGLSLFIGINHHGKTNPLNLTYDFIEPYRPLIDYYLYHNTDRLDQKLNITVRKELVHLLNAQVIVDGKSYTVLYSMELLVKSYLNCLEQGEVRLALPNIAKINFHTFFERL